MNDAKIQSWNDWKEKKMSNFAIEVENLGKCYQIGELEDYYTLRDSLADIVKYPFKLISNGGEVKKKPEMEYIWALKDINFEVKHGEIIGIIGRNGAGKSTLLKILSRITTPTEGKARINGSVGSLLEVGTGFHPELTGRENIYLNGSILGMSKKEIERKFDEIVDFAQIEKFLHTPVKRYSPGMYVRLAFAVAAHMETEILIIDEVLAVGDIAFKKKCLGKMGEVSKEGRTVLFVSHNMGSISSLCQRVIMLENGRSAFDGNTNNGVNYYYSGLYQKNENNKDNVIYKLNTESDDIDNFIIDEIEILDYEYKIKDRIYTFDDVVFRIHFKCPRYVEKGSVVISIQSFDNKSIILLSTQPDSNYPISLEPGAAYVDCKIKNLPLTAGEYLLFANLAIPNAEYLTKNVSYGRFRVLEKDVFNSGLPPKSNRSLVAINHEWEIKSKN